MTKKRPKPQEEVQEPVETAVEAQPETVEPELAEAASADAVEPSDEPAVSIGAVDEVDEEIPCITEENVVASNGEAVDSEGKKAE